MQASTTLTAGPLQRPWGAGGRAAPQHAPPALLAPRRPAQGRPRPPTTCTAMPTHPSKGSPRATPVEPGAPPPAAARCQGAQALPAGHQSSLPAAPPACSPPRHPGAPGSRARVQARSYTQQRSAAPPLGARGSPSARPPTVATRVPAPHLARRSSLPPTDAGGRTLYDNWTQAVERYGARPCLGSRVGSAYKYLSFMVRKLDSEGVAVLQLVGSTWQRGAAVPTACSASISASNPPSLRRPPPLGTAGGGCAGGRRGVCYGARGGGAP